MPRRFDRIAPKDRILPSRFGYETTTSFQMSLFSSILSSRNWKFIGSCVVMSKREVISCLSLACVALISSRSPERASLGGFPAGKREILSLHGNRSVERLEEQLLLYLEHHPHLPSYRLADAISTFASTYKIATPLPTPSTIAYLFAAQPHVSLPYATP